MIDLPDKNRHLIKQILRKNLAAIDCEIRIFGSRINGKARRFSDIDIIVKGKEKMPENIFKKIKENFSESDLPIKVDIHDWQETSTSFRKIISKNYEILDLN